jgi:hypothetical protein
MKEPTPLPAQDGSACGMAGGKLLASLFSIALVCAVLWPIHQNWKSKPHDSFPLSYFPMFSAKRKAVESFCYVVGRDENGARYLIPYLFIGLAGENQTRRQIDRIVREHRATELAGSVARNLAGESEAPWSRIATVAVVRGSYVVDDYFHGRKAPASEKVLASCAVERNVP